MENIAPALLDWFYKNHRILPFREDPTPYHVWLSEVMLQQTRVSAVLPYYERFLAALPDIPALAACDEEKLHKLWEGLGYNSRVRNLLKAAKIDCEQYGGQAHLQPHRMAAVRCGPHGAGAGGPGGLRLGQPRGAAHHLHPARCLCRLQGPDAGMIWKFWQSAQSFLYRMDRKRKSCPQRL